MHAAQNRSKALLHSCLLVLRSQEGDKKDKRDKEHKDSSKKEAKAAGSDSRRSSQSGTSSKTAVAASSKPAVTSRYVKATDNTLYYSTACLV